MLLFVAYFEALLSHGTLKFGDKSNFLTFFLKMPIQRFSPY